MSESGAGKAGTPGTGQGTIAPFDLWTEWMRANMGAVTATPGASVPWLMTPGGSTGEGGAGPPGVGAGWVRANMGAVTATPGASVPWLMTPGVSTGEEVAALPEGAIRHDPLLSTVEKLWDANPVQNVLPLNWVEITRCLQTLWMREMSDPARALQRATDVHATLSQIGRQRWG